MVIIEKIGVKYFCRQEQCTRNNVMTTRATQHKIRENHFFPQTAEEISVE